MAKYSLGGIAIDLDDASASTSEIPQNTTIFVGQFTPKPGKAEVIKGLQTESQVFQHFEPTQKVAFTDPNGKSVSETLRFASRSDFGKQGIINQSPLLTGIQNQKEGRKEIIKTIKKDREVQGILDEPEARAAFIGGLKALIAQLEEAS